MHTTYHALASCHGPRACCLRRKQGGTNIDSNINPSNTRTILACIDNTPCCLSATAMLVMPIEGIAAVVARLTQAAAL